MTRDSRRGAGPESAADQRHEFRKTDGRPPQGGPPRGPDSSGGRAPELRGGRWLMWIIFAVIVVLFFSLASRARKKTEELKWSEFEELLEDEQIKTVAVQGRVYFGEYVPGRQYRYYTTEGPDIDKDPGLRDKLKQNAKGGFKFKPPSRVLEFLIYYFLPMFLVLGIIWFFFFRQLRASGGPGGLLSFGKSRATLVTKEKTHKTFADVAGIEEAKEEVQEVITFLKNPKRFLRMGARIPKGVLLIGAPGTGKTLLAKAIAGEADVPFYIISGSDFVEMFVGVGASRVRDLFQQAKENSPCIIFLDEIDAVGRRRGTGLGGGHDEREQTLNAILVEMDGFSSDEKIIVMAATNRPDVLDPALLRPGRFDRRIIVDHPDVRGRGAILMVHGRHVRLADDVDFTRMAQITPGFSGADLENVINEAALLAVMRNKERVDMADLEEARDKVIWGKEKRSRVLDDEDRRVTAYHEAGHALLAHIIPEVDKLHKVTIIPRGMALGATMHLPTKDEYNKTKRKLMGDLAVLYGGRVAEEMFCDDISTGAKNDIERATEIARHMVCDWGMSEKLGPVDYAGNKEHVFLGHEIARQQRHSEATALEIDKEIRGIIDTAFERAGKTLEERRGDVERVAEALLKYEVLDADDFDKLLAGEELSRRPSMRGKAPSGSPSRSRAGRETA